MKAFKKQDLLNKAIEVFIKDIRGANPHYRGVDGDTQFYLDGSTFGVKYSVNLSSGDANIMIYDKRMTDIYFSHSITIAMNDYGITVVCGAEYKFKPIYESDKRALAMHMERMQRNITNIINNTLTFN